MHRDDRVWVAGLVGLGAVAAYIVVPALLPRAAAVPTRHTTGLLNTGNDCFANATFQALAALPGLREFLAAEHNASKPWTSALSALLDELAQEDACARKMSIWPTLHVMERLCAARMSRGQQDAHELLLKVLELLDRERGTGERELPMCGVLTDTIRCLRCGHTTTTPTEFLVLERFPGEDVLAPQTERVEGFACSACGPTVIEKTTRVSRMPRVLAVHMNRSAYASASFRNAAPVAVAPRLGLLGEMRLRAVVYHHGNHYRGHYTAARAKLPGGDADSRRRPWWLISDDDVRQGTTRQALGRATEVYMLFYEAAPAAGAGAVAEAVVSAAAGIEIEIENKKQTAAEIDAAAAAATTGASLQEHE